jgi:hypothetical protein
MRNFQNYEAPLFEWEEDDTSQTVENSDNSDNDISQNQPSDTTEGWDDMQNTLDQADNYLPDNQTVDSQFDNSEEPMNIVFRLLLNNGLSVYDIRNLFRRYPRKNLPQTWGTPSQMQSYAPLPASQTGGGKGALMVPRNGQRYVDVLFRNPRGVQNPEKNAVNFLQQQRRDNPNLLRNIKQVNMILPKKPCVNCTRNLKSGLSRVLPRDSRVKMRYPNPAPKTKSLSGRAGARPRRELNEIGCACQHKQAEMNQENSILNEIFQENGY